MKVIVKSNEYIAIPTKKKSKCIYLLGQYLNKETCTVEMDNDCVRSITCVMKGADSYDKTVTIVAKELSWGSKYIILDMDGNLVDVITEEQFDNKYAILQDNKEG